MQEQKKIVDLTDLELGLAAVQLNNELRNIPGLLMEIDAELKKRNLPKPVAKGK